MSKTIGQQLRRARENQSLTIDQAATNTRIRARYLQAIEDGDFDTLPSAVHVRGFVRAYADFLGQDGEHLLEELQSEESSKSEKSAPLPVKASGKDSPILPQGEAPSHQEADAVFIEVGQWLIRQRELLGLSLEDVERHTHIREHYLRALEAGDMTGLPSPVQGRGMLHNYSAFLGMDTDAVLLRFAEGLQTQLKARQEANPEPKPKPAPVRERAKPPNFFRRLVSADTFIGGSIAVFLAAFILWGIIRIFNQTSNNAPTLTAPSIAEILLATPTPSDTPTPLPFTNTPAPQSRLFPSPAIPTDSLDGGTPAAEQTGASVQVYLTVQQRTFLRVIVDGEVQFDGRVLPGTAYPFIGDTQVEVITGNGAGIEVFYNGIDLGRMGEIGEIVDQIFTVQGVFTPTPTITATPSISPTVPFTTPATPLPAANSPIPTETP